MKTKTCPLCQKDLFSGANIGCKLCGMPLEDKNKLFCSNICEDIYGGIHESKII